MRRKEREEGKGEGEEDLPESIKDLARFGFSCALVTDPTLDQDNSTAEIRRREGREGVGERGDGEKEKGGGEREGDGQDGGGAGQNREGDDGYDERGFGD